jgi:hypothetical protein
MLVGGHLLQVRVSLGIVQADSDQNTAQLMEQAMVALAEAKVTDDSHSAWFVESAITELS